MKKYPSTSRILVAIDCIVFGFDGNELKLLLIKRNFEPEKGKWSLMGGFLGNHESLTDGINRILYSLTGLQDIYFEEVNTFGALERDPVERTISLCFFALINIQQQNNLYAQSINASWVSLKRKPKLIFDHDSMVSMALKKLRVKAAMHPIGFELLPEKFTIPQFQKLYEAIYDIPFDRRNFSKKVLSTGLLKDTNEKNQTGNTKKAILYKLDKKKYKAEITSYHYFISDLSKLTRIF